MNHAKYIGGKACAKHGEDAYKFGKIVAVKGSTIVIQIGEKFIMSPAQASVIMLKGNK